jgi:cell division FtsZ-interacting protein ZapD
MISTTALTMIGDVIRESAADPRTAENIRTIHQTAEGAEILRLIVRDDLGGAADTIADALWVNS